MSRAVIHPAVLNGRVVLPPSKSDAHRLLICAALAGGVSRISRMALSKDIEATLRVLKALGADIRMEGDTAIVRGVRFEAGDNEGGGGDNRPIGSDAVSTFAPESRPTPGLEIGCEPGPEPVCDCGESGSTLRFLLPVAAALGRPVRFMGEGRLPQRPIDALTALFQERGLTCRSLGEDNLPLRLTGRLPGGTYRLPGDVSSQYITGLLLALPLTGAESRIQLTTPLQSAGYVDMTLRTMAAFGVRVERLPDGYRIPAGSRYRPTDCRVEADWSAAAFYLAAGALGGSIALAGLNPDSAQGDKAAVELFGRLGARIGWEKGDLLVSPGRLRGAVIDVSQVPDMAPALAVCAAFAPDRTVLTGGARLRIKESDRIAAIAAGLTAMGVQAAEQPDGLVIPGGSRPRGGLVDGAGDHRIVMAFSIAAAFAAEESVVTDAQAAAKSYPGFFADYNMLGGKAHVV